MNITSSDENISDDELTGDSIQSVETGLPKIYRNTILKIDLSSSDEEIVEIMSNAESSMEIMSTEESLEENTHEEIINIDNVINIGDCILSGTIPIQDRESLSSETIINQLAQSTTSNECIICLDGSNENELIKNKLCNCVYAYHAECYYNWINNSRKNTCILCKKPIIKGNNYITNIRLLNILNNSYVQSRSDFTEGIINIVEINTTNRTKLCSTCINWLYNYNIKYIEKIIYLLFASWLVLLGLLIIESTDG